VRGKEEEDCSIITNGPLRGKIQQIIFFHYFLEQWDILHFFVSLISFFYFLVFFSFVIFFKVTNKGISSHIAEVREIETEREREREKEV
jgi:hypothetical protein